VTRISDDIVQEIVIDAPPSEVWRHLADREALSRWLMPTSDFEPRVGATFTFRTRPIEGWDGVVHCAVREVERPRRLVFTWASAAIGPETTVAITLEDLRGRTRVRLVHSGWSALPPERRWLVDEHQRGWARLLDEGLKRHVEART
jgi:uncharacterized protein YndB with AHSA1/START domain